MKYNNEVIERAIMEALVKRDNGFEIDREELLRTIMNDSDKDFGIDNKYTEEELQHSVYIHINKTAGNKVYVGQTGKRPTERWASRYNNQYLGRSIKKHKWNWKEDFFHIVLCYGLTQEEADALEIALIAILQSTDKELGYNIANGGNGVGTISQEMREKMSASRKGENNIKSIKVYCDKLIFACLRECTEYYGVEYNTLYGWINNTQIMNSYFVEKNLHYATEEEINSYERYDKTIHGEKCKDVILVTNGNIIYCNSLIFKSVAQCAKFYGANQATMTHWLNKNSMPTDFQELELRYATEEDVKNYEMYDPNIHGETYNGFIMPSNNGNFVYCDSLIFTSGKECAEYYDMSSVTMNSWLNGARPTKKEFQELGLRIATQLDLKTYDKYDSKIHGEKAEELIKDERKFIHCDSLIFTTLTECAEYYDIEPNTLKAWLIGRYTMNSYFVEKNLHYVSEEEINSYERYDKTIHGEKCKDVILVTGKAKYVYCNSLIFKSIAQCEKYFSLTKGVMKGWLRENKIPSNFQELGLRYITEEDINNYEMYNPKKHGEKTKDFIMPNSKAKYVYCDGMIFKSIAQCERYYNEHRATMKHWLKVNRIPSRFQELGLRYATPEDIQNFPLYKEDQAEIA